MKLISKYQIYFLTVFFLLAFFNASSSVNKKIIFVCDINPKKNIQSSTLNKDSIKIDKKWTVAKKATIFSSLLPGLGQTYNKKYWKVPVIYAAIGGLGFSIIKNNQQYIIYHNALLQRANGIAINDPLPQYSNDNLVTLKRYYRRYRDLSIMAVALVYVLQIVDANVDGHLANFDVDNISLNISPYSSLSNEFSKKCYNGISLKMTF